MSVLPLRFGVLGPLVVYSGGTAVLLPRSQVMRGLLGGLLLAGGRPLSAERLAGLVWSGRRSEVSRSAVQVAVCRLRGWLRQRREPGWERVSVEHGADGYRLLVDGYAVDVSRFDARVDRSRTVADGSERFRLLRAAMCQVRGAPLEGIAVLDPDDPLIRRTESAIQEAGLAFARVAVAAGRAADAVTCLEALARRHPLVEPVHACLIEVLAAAGRPAEALSRYAALRALLRAELGVNPGRPVEAARQAVLAA